MADSPLPPVPPRVLALPWARGYGWDTLLADAVAGATLAAYVLPAALGDATLAGLPPEVGLYACVFSGLFFWLFSSSRLTAVTVTSALSLLIGTSLGPLAGGDPARFAALAAATALLTAGVALVAWRIRAGVLMDFISEAVMAGFKAGVGLTLVSTQLPKLCGFHGLHAGDFWERAAHFLRHLLETNPMALAFGLGSLGLLLLGRRGWKNRPVALVVVGLAMLAATWLPIDAWGVPRLQSVPGGVPLPHWPAVTWLDLNDLLPLALAAFMLGAVETVALGRLIAAKTGVRFQANREFLGLAAANLASGLGGGYPVSGGVSQSLVNVSSGARTPVSGLVAALLMLVVALFFAPLLEKLPQPVLAAVVLVAVVGLLNVGALRALWRQSRGEFTVAMVALVGVLHAGLLNGVLIGGVISLVQVLRRAARPHVAVLGRIPGTRRFSDMERHPDNEPVPGLLILRPEMSLVYFNASHVCEAVLDRVDQCSQPVRRVLLDLSAAPQVDLQSAEALGRLAADLEARGVRLQAVETHADVRDRLRACGLERTLGHIDRFTSTADAVEQFTAGAA